MNSSNRITVNINENQCYFLSLFYAREKCGEMINAILHFYYEKQTYISNCLISFSTEKGEHLQVTFTTLVEKNNKQTEEINTYFQSFFKRYPSISSSIFPYGKAIWCNYPNNSLVWNKIKIHCYSKPCLSFHQKTIDLSLKLLMDDFSEDAFLSLGIYLITKGLCLFTFNEQKDVLLQALQEASISYPLLVYTAKDLVNEINISEVSEVVESCRNEKNCDYSQELIDWLNDANNIKMFYGFEKFCTLTCEITDLKGLRQLMILELLKKLSTFAK